MTEGHCVPQEQISATLGETVAKIGFTVTLPEKRVL